MFYVLLTSNGSYESAGKWSIEDKVLTLVAASGATSTNQMPPVQGKITGRTNKGNVIHGVKKK